MRGQPSEEQPWRGLFLIAALGPMSDRYDRTSATLRAHFSGWDCLALAWSKDVLTSSDPGAVYIAQRCRVEVRLRMRWGSMQNLTTPAIVAPYDYIMIVVDDLIVPPSFNATRFVEDARRHNLSKAAPTVWGIPTFQGPVAAWQSIGTSFEHVRYAQRSCAAAGGRCSVRLTSWVETFMTLYTRAAWECHFSMFDDSILHDDRGVVGYGYDRCFKKHCGAQHWKQGVLLDYAIQHASGESTIAAAQPKEIGDGGGGGSSRGSSRRGGGSYIQAVAAATARVRSSYIWAQKQALTLEDALIDAHGRDARWATRTCESRHDACGRKNKMNYKVCGSASCLRHCLYSSAPNPDPDPNSNLNPNILTLTP